MLRPVNTWKLALAAMMLARAVLAQDPPAAESPSAEAAPPAESPSTAPSPDASTGSIASSVAPAASPSIMPPGSVPGSFVVKEGDLVAGKSRDGKVRVMKVVKINFIEGDRLLHAMAFKETFKSYEEAAAAAAEHKLTVLIYHLPIDGEGLTADSNKVLQNEPVTDKDLEGYKEYLKETGPAPTLKK
jgi:hypothetical protein